MPKTVDLSISIQFHEVMGVREGLERTNSTADARAELPGAWLGGS